MPVRRPAADARVLPTWGLYAHKVKTLELQNVRLSLTNTDVRPALIADEVEHLELDTFKTPTASIQPLALTGVSELSLRDTDLKIVGSKCVGLNAGGDPFAATTVIENGSGDGLTRVQVSLDGQRQTRWVAVAANERKEVVFRRWEAPGPGKHTLQCENLQKQLNFPER